MQQVDCTLTTFKIYRSGCSTNLWTVLSGFNTFTSDMTARISRWLRL